tara:strand:- start:1066 stop:1554 length:489 start_codon:yes stop_codon:yes gene_type:complete
MNKKIAEKYLPPDGKSGYTPQYTKRGAKYSPKKAIKSFRDLEVYRQTLACSILVMKYILPELEEQKYPAYKQITECTIAIPLQISEAHGMRFDDFDTAISTLEISMCGCNKMIVFLEQAAGLYKEELDIGLIEDICNRYITVRGKILRLEKSWKKFKASPRA